MSNFKRYTMVIRRDSEGFATPALKVRQKGEVLKFDEVKELLQTDAQQLNAKISTLIAEIYRSVPADRVYSREEVVSYLKRVETSAV